ncbi:hypothetical protein ONZ45_g1329 [Pleurotus djamor]|nr:hypothetical protein ONZ45_g1329 [Pleurotus djamor]
MQGSNALPAASSGVNASQPRRMRQLRLIAPSPDTPTTSSDSDRHYDSDSGSDSDFQPESRVCSRKASSRNVDQPSTSRPVPILPKKGNHDGQRGGSPLPPRRGRRPSDIPRSVREAQRKLKHSAIEKTRRTKTNEALAALREMVPSEYARAAEGAADDDEGAAISAKKKGKGSKEDRVFKLEILVMTVSYMKDLQGKVRLLESQPSQSPQLESKCRCCCAQNEDSKKRKRRSEDCSESEKDSCDPCGEEKRSKSHQIDFPSRYRGHRCLNDLLCSPSDAPPTTFAGHDKHTTLSPRAKWDSAQGGTRGPGVTDPGNGFESVTEGKGKLSPTSSHLFKLILPLDRFTKTKDDEKYVPPTVLLLHPSQPLSHVSRLISASLHPTAPDAVSFRSTSPSGRQFQWADSTDVGDFIKDAARAAEFSICVTEKGKEERVIEVEVPTFADRTRFLRRRLRLIESQLGELETLKKAYDNEARRGARRMALGGFGMLVAYWGIVARLTFWDFGWDIMEPITYLSGLSTVICGYLWFLYQGREVSYSSVLDQSISSRRQALYKARGLDIERYFDLVSGARSIRREIGKIAEDYDEAREQEEDEQAQDGDPSKDDNEIK